MYFLILSALLLASPVAPPPNESRGPLVPAAPLPPRKAVPAYCTGEYSNDTAALSKQSIELSARADAQFTYCVRVKATYECLSYSGDGNVRRSKKTATAHGTAFAYKRLAGGETLLASNFHVTEYPAVSDEDHPVEGVPVGCKKVADSLKLVDNEKDDYEVDDVALSRVVSDPSLDIAVVKAKGASLNVMPWRFGKSAQLHERNVVDVRGFPLGAFKATSQGKVVSPYDRDDFKDWDHDDFVIDAPMSPGNSGSPVMAISCTTGEYELVGIFHADYSRGNQLNLAVHVDEVRDLLTTLKRGKTGHADPAPLDGPARKRLVDEVDEVGMHFFPLGALTAIARARPDGALVFQVFSRDFPVDPWPAVVLEDLPAGHEGGFGELGRTWWGSARGLKEVLRSELDAETRGTLEKGLESLRRAAMLSVAHRRAISASESSRESRDLASKLEKNLLREAALSKELAQSFLELEEKDGPHPSELVFPFSRPFAQSK